MNKNILIIIFFLFCVIDSSSFAEKPKSIMNKLRQMEQEAQKPMLDDLLETTQKQQKTDYETNLGIDSGTKAVLANLKNPFTPQLPQKIPPPPPVEVSVEPSLPPPVEYTPPPPTILKPEFKMSGVVWNTDKPQAIMNGQVVGVGDLVAEWEITAISQNGVEIQNGDQKFTIEQEKILTEVPPESLNSADWGGRDSLNRNLISPSQKFPRGQTQQRKTQSFQYKSR